jgi:hypothetical protein
VAAEPRSAVAATGLSFLIPDLPYLAYLRRLTHLAHGYSYLNATIGSTFVARRAGR